MTADTAPKRDPAEVRPTGRTAVRVRALKGAAAHDADDVVATEEPLEIRIADGILGALPTAVALTMRTPGDPDDVELALGFLHGEGIVASTADVAHATYCLDPDLTAEQRWNVVTVTLAPGRTAGDLDRLERHFTTTSACGVCGKARLDQLTLDGYRPLPPGPTIAPSTLYALPDRLRAAQGLFADTGGLHAAGLFDAAGTLVAAREDVGRHNAVDKLVGWALREGRLPLSRHVLLVSGRASFEILQKALAAGIPIVCAVSAPSSLAVAVAERFGMTLVGFLRGERGNVYAGAGRVEGGVGAVGGAGRPLRRH